ncbi:MAG: cation transporter [Sphingobacteriales bacterium]|nr:MAG: cation transporter [Sphingobacteriales bacterium]
MSETNKHPAKKARASTIIGLLISVVLVVVKAVAGIVGNSYALVADAIESASDIITSLILLVGFHFAAKAPDEDHPYGHGKAEPLAAIVVGLSLLVIAGIITAESIKNILTPHDLPKSFTLYVLLGVIAVKEVLFRFVKGVADETESHAVKADAWHHRSDAISSAAAFIGISIALYFGKGYESADDWAALVAAVIIAINGFKILRPALDEVMDAAPSGEMVRKVEGIALTVGGVLAVEKCYVRKMGFEYFVDLHIEVNGKLTVFEGHEIAHRVKEAIQAADTRFWDVLIHVEPAE